MNIQIIKNSGKIEQYDFEKILHSIKQANSETSEELSLNNISKQLEKYLDIIALSQESKLSSKHLFKIVNKLLEENELFDTQKKYLNFKSQQKSYFTQNEINKLLKYYSPNQSEIKLDECLEKFIREENQSLLSVYKSKKILPNINSEETIVLQDNLDNIMEGIKKMSVNAQQGIKSNINFSKIRPRNAIISSTMGRASGPIAFMEIFITAFKQLINGFNKNNYNKLQIILNLNHPDIFEYLTLVRKTKNADIRFIIQKPENFEELIKSKSELELINPQNQEVYSSIDLNNSMDLIISSIKENKNLKIRSCESAYLYSKNQNFSNFTVFLNNYYDQFELKTKELINDLENIKNHYQEHNIKINFNGFYDLLFRLKLEFESVKTLEIITQILDELSKKIKKYFILVIDLDDPIIDLTENSSGLDPYDHLIVEKTNLEGQKVLIANPVLENYLNETSLHTDDILNQIAEDKSIQNLNVIDPNIKSLLITGKDINPEWNIKIQSLFENVFEYVEKKLHLPNSFNFKKLISLANISNIHIDNYLDELKEKHKTTNYLVKTIQNRNSVQVQPPLFQLKKTEEISLPPITSKHQNE
ncbi:hypothetical protein GF376_03015 [Candidatus Peregrinibacteria bacterium]|nr:hypothetical protein [Candidatus Peregrinibacteria bacterium]